MLYELLADRPLSTFVMFSSIAGVWGSSGQGGYSAANAFLDAFAEHRRALGSPTTAIAWGMWAGGGMATGEATAALERIGLKPMSPELAMEALNGVEPARCNVDGG